jgi:Tol biopolymer transport system component
MRRWPVVASAVALALSLSASAQAAFPGQNGKIAFSATNTNPTYPNTDIYSVNPDGSGLVQIINENGGTWEDSNFDSVPEWSPDGTQLVFNSLWIEGGDPEPSIDRVNADGTGRVVVQPARYNPVWSPDGAHLLYALGDPGAHDEPGDEHGWLFTSDPDGTNETFFRSMGARPSKASWSPDGMRIAFPLVTYGCINDCQGDLYTADAADGGALVQVTNNPYDEIQPDWSPDGTKIAFASNADGDYDIYSINRDGSGIAQLTNAPGYDLGPSWSPDGTKIAFGSNRSGPFHVFTMNADGSGVSDLIAGRDPDWQPITGPRRADYKNQAAFCRAERDFWGDGQFRDKYGTNGNGANAFGKCVSGK